MSEEIKLLPCPFCGSTEIEATSDFSFSSLNKTFGRVKCGNCDAMFTCAGKEQEFVKIEDDMYRLVPARNGLDIAVERWNRRAGESK